VSPFQVTRTALRALSRNLMRSVLTVLGIVIGTASVIALVGMGDGAKRRLAQSFAAMGTDIVIVNSGSASTGGWRGGFGTQLTITYGDLKAISTELPLVREAAPFMGTRASLVSDQRNWATKIMGTSPEFFDIRSWAVAIGDPMTDEHVDASAKVVLIGRTVAEKLFDSANDAVGQFIRIRNVPFTVIGVLAEKGQSASGEDFDDTVIIPASTFQTRLLGGPSKYVQGIYASAISSNAVPRMQDSIRQLLRDRHRIPPGKDEDFSARNVAEIANAQQDNLGMFTSLFAGVAGVSLLVGGIGIMNIMLVSVTERTREIGLRMAIGATPWDILRQFLTEAMALSAIGGVIGVSIGFFIAAYMAHRFSWPLVVRPETVGLAVLSSAMFGLVFGLYPARKASRLHPIEALRFE
jgi:putative ABC transport system permease protein